MTEPVAFARDLEASTIQEDMIARGIAEGFVADLRPKLLELKIQRDIRRFCTPITTKGC